MSLRTGTRSEEGSLPLVLLAAIILAGVLVALFTTVITGTNSARFDRNFAQAFQIADAGIQQSFVQLLELDEDLLDPDSPGYPEEVDPCGEGTASDEANVKEGECTTILDDGSSFTWTYERVGELRQWTVTSQGTYLGVSRAVQADVGEGPLFSGALMSDDDLHWSGGGTTVEQCEAWDAEGSIEPFPIDIEGDAIIDPTGECVSQLTLWGVDRIITGDDRIDTYLSGTYPIGHPEEGEPKEVRFTGEPLDMPNIGARAFQGPTETFPNGGPCHGEPVQSLGDTLYRGETYCLNDFKPSQGQAVSIESNPEDPSVPDDAWVLVYVRNDVSFRANTDINFTPDAETRAVDLQIYAGGTEVIIRSTAKGKAAIWAPAADCHSQGGAGEDGEFHGALACFNIDLSGNWTYDASVQEIKGSTFNIARYSEEPPS